MAGKVTRKKSAKVKKVEALAAEIKDVCVGISNERRATIEAKVDELVKEAKK